MEVPVVDLHVITKDKTTIRIEARVVPEITCPIQKQPLDVEGRFQILKEIVLADTIANQPETVKIDALLGEDFYYQFVEQERIKLDENLFLLRSKLGWILAGQLKCEESTGRESHATSASCPVWRSYGTPAVGPTSGEVLELGSHWCQRLWPSV